MDKREQLRLLNREAYQAIAATFSPTRHGPWQEMVSLANGVRAGDKVLDLGCGNGRLLKALPGVNFDYFGIDATERLVAYAREAFPDRKFDVQDFESLRLPTNYFDHIFCIASFHHVVGNKDRLEFLKKCQAALKPNGRLVMTVWNLWQRKYIKYIFKFPGKKVDWNDFFIPWKATRPTVWRYYHSFTAPELRSLLHAAGFRNINVDTQTTVEHGGRSRNYIVQAIK